jgi:6,7-dimethyl-8-ribityllumazine synthase
VGEPQPPVVRDAAGLRIAVVRARYNEAVTLGLLAGAEEYLAAAGASYDVYESPGSFELPLICAELADAGYDAIVALGAVINGETDHYEHVAGCASEGLMQVSLTSRKPVSFGVLTVKEEKHALSRSAPGPGNKGAEAAAAAVETALVLSKIPAHPF